MSLPFQYSTVDEYVSGTILQIQNAPESFKILNIGKYYLRGDGDLTSEHVASMLEHARYNPNLVEIAFHKIVVDDDTISALTLLLGRPKKWRRVHFNSCNSEIVRVLSISCLVEHIQIRNNSCRDPEYQALGLNFHSNHLLTKLELVEEIFRGKVSTQSLAEGLKT